jgi:hypothetical protein
MRWPAGCTNDQGNEMKRFQWIAVTAGLAALAACSDRDEDNLTNVEVNADENLALPPADNIDMNAGMNVDANADTNAIDNSMNNTADNTTNAY